MPCDRDMHLYSVTLVNEDADDTLYFDAWAFSEDDLRKSIEQFFENLPMIQVESIIECDEEDYRR